MGEKEYAVCMICGQELPVEQMEVLFTGRVKYRCYKCVAYGEKQIKARIGDSMARRYANKLKEKNGWK